MCMPNSSEDTEEKHIKFALRAQTVWIWTTERSCDGIAEDGCLATFGHIARGSHKMCQLVEDHDATSFFSTPAMTGQMQL